MANPIQSHTQSQRYLDYPYGVSSTGAPSTTNPDDHLRDLILQVLFTIPANESIYPSSALAFNSWCLLRTVTPSEPAHNSSSPTACNAGWAIEST